MGQDLRTTKETKDGLQEGWAKINLVKWEDEHRKTSRGLTKNGQNTYMLEKSSST